MQKWKIAHIGATIACRNHFLPCPLQHLRLEASRTLRPWLACVKVCDEQLHQHHDCLVERSATARGGLSCAGDSQKHHTWSTTRRRGSQATAHMHVLRHCQPSWPKSANPASTYKPHKRRS